MSSHRLRLVAAAAALLTLSACGSGTESESKDSAGSKEQKGSAGSFPLTVEHALGKTTIPAKPKRVATVNWANHEVPLALGVVPVGMAAANFGDHHIERHRSWPPPCRRGRRRGPEAPRGWPS